jgi:polyketide cyclase/dehydrase/lipid transport protein
MRYPLKKIATGVGLAIVGGGLAIVCVATVTAAQAPAPAAAQAAPVWPVGVGPGSAASPTYISIPLEIAVNKPAAEVWKRVGKFCDIAEWLRIPTCTITAGKDGEFGAVRSVANEVLVAKTELSYTYTQTPAFQAGGRGGPRPYNLYHGTLEARPVTPTTSKLVYTLFFDNSMLADDAAREADKAAKSRQFMTALENMKILAEGGTLPPAPARGTGPAGAPPAAPPSPRN